MLLIQVGLCALTGNFEMSALKTLSAGKRAQVLPGMGWALTWGTSGNDSKQARSTDAAKRPGGYLTNDLTPEHPHDCVPSTAARLSFASEGCRLCTGA
jgi:hypothetical protein